MMLSSPASNPSFWLREYHDARDLFSLTRPNRPRAFASICAAAFMVLLCSWMNHFQLAPTVFSFILMQRHKCAKLLLATCAWCLIECTHVALHYAKHHSEQH